MWPVTALIVRSQVGACGLAPVVLVGDQTYGRVAPDDVKNILKEYE